MAIQFRENCCLPSGEPGKGKKRIWMIARQHPGESMAEWFVEGEHAPTLALHCMSNSSCYNHYAIDVDGLSMPQDIAECIVQLHVLQNVVVDIRAGPATQQHTPKLFPKLWSLTSCCRNTALAQKLAFGLLIAWSGVVLLRAIGGCLAPLQ